VKLLREPLVHFVIAGSLLFGGHAWLNRGTPSSEAIEPVHIGTGEIRWLRETFASQWRRQPTADELKDLLTTLVNEELLAREARMLGLDRDDTIVRRRLAQKLAFLIEDTSGIAEPDEAELRRYHAAHAERYRTEPLISFRHVVFSPQRRPDAEGDARQALAALAPAGMAGAEPPSSDPSLVDTSFADVDTRAVSSLFGTAFALALFNLPPGSWSGPIKSAFGVHLVVVTLKREAEPRPFEDVRQAVAADWRRQKNADTKQAYLARLREKFGVTIDAQALSASETASAASLAAR
jgi:parvulin-like peptidyl-prolyl isomerase